jgi:toxin ParE1/3/4
MKIVWTEPAVEDLRELHAYIARDSEMYASGFVERIVLAVERLVDHPRVGRIVPETNEDNIRELLFQRYRIIYRIKTIILKCYQ